MLHDPLGVHPTLALVRNEVRLLGHLLHPPLTSFGEFLCSGNSQVRGGVRILGFISAQKLGNFSTFWGDVLTLLHREREEQGRDPQEKIQKISGENSPKLRSSVACSGRTCPDKGFLISGVAKLKGDNYAECKLSNGWSLSYREIKALGSEALGSAGNEGSKSCREVIKSISQSSKELYDQWFSAHFCVF